jgi:hypothetical protein
MKAKTRATGDCATTWSGASAKSLELLRRQGVAESFRDGHGKFMWRLATKG